MSSWEYAEDEWEYTPEEWAQWNAAEERSGVIPWSEPLETAEPAMSGKGAKSKPKKKKAKDDAPLPEPEAEPAEEPPPASAESKLAAAKDLKLDFGKWKDIKLDVVATRDPGYLRWIGDESKVRCQQPPLELACACSACLLCSRLRARQL